MKNIEHQVKLSTGFVFIVVVIAITIIFLEGEGQDSKIKIIIASSLALVSLIFYVVKNLGAAKRDADGAINEDEFSKLVKIHSGNTAFYYSLILWLLLFAFQDQISEMRTLLGFGILGSSAMYGVCS